MLNFIHGSLCLDKFGVKLLTLNLKTMFTKSLHFVKKKDLYYPCFDPLAAPLKESLQDHAKYY